MNGTATVESPFSVIHDSVEGQQARPQDEGGHEMSLASNQILWHRPLKVLASETLLPSQSQLFNDMTPTVLVIFQACIIFSPRIILKVANVEEYSMSTELSRCSEWDICSLQCHQL